MKKHSLLPIAVFVMTMIGLSGIRAWAGSPLNVYSGSVEDAALHTFSSSAVSFSFTGNSDAGALWLKAGGGCDTLTETSKTVKTGNFSIGFDLAYGELTAKYFGLTAGGTVYFGAEDALYPNLTPWEYAVNNSEYPNLKDYILMRYSVYDGSLGSTLYYKDQTVKSSDSTSVRFETEGEVLWVEYRNLILEDNSSNHNPLPISFQYKIEKEGRISLLPISMASKNALNTSTKAYGYYFYFGLMHTDLNTSVFMDDLTGKVSIGKYNPLPMTLDRHPLPGKAYSFNSPALCRAIEHPEILRWGHKVEGSNLYLNEPNNIVCKEGTKILALVSESARLEGDDLPKNGVTYSGSGQAIGTSAGVSLGSVLSNTLDDTYTTWFSPNPIKNLKPATVYYLHLFPYNDNCSGGPAYNTTEIPSVSFTTYAPAPQSIAAVDSTLTRTSVSLHINSAQNYLLAVSRKQLPAGEMVSLQGTYAKGDTIRHKSYLLQVVEADADVADVAVTGLEEGSDYYYYAWTNAGHGQIYSSAYAQCGVSTVHELSDIIELGFASAAATDATVEAPAGWNYASSNTFPFSTGASEQGNYIYTYAYGPGGNLSFNAATSPVIDKFGYGSVRASVDIFYYTEANNFQRSPSKPTASGDSVMLQYQDENGAWITVAAATKDSEFDPQTGAYTLETPEFTPQAQFRLRIVVRSNFTMAEIGGGTPYACIRTLKVEPALNCAAVTGLHTEQTRVLHNAATLFWEEGNIVASDGFRIRCKAATAAEWESEAYVKTLQYTVTGLQPATPYIAEVTAVCKAGDSSLRRSLGFSTVGLLPYTLQVEEGVSTLPAGVKIKTGVLSEEGPVTFAQDSLELWEVVNSGIGLENMWLEKTQNDQWLMLPVLSTGGMSGTINIDIDLEAWSVNANSGAQSAPAFSQDDRFEVLVSTDGTFRAADTVKRIDLTALTLQPQSFSMTYDASGAELLFIAVYTRFTLPSTETDENASPNSLVINSIKVQWENIACDPVSNVRQSNLAKTSVDISWRGSNLEYAIAYKLRTGEAYDTVFTDQTTYTLTGLTPGSSYQYTVWGYCESGRNKPSAPSAPKYFNTIPECVTPTIEVLGYTWYNVTIAMGPADQTRIIDLWRSAHPNDHRYHHVFTNMRDTVTIQNIFALGPQEEDYVFNEAFTVRCRAVCAEGDSSAWSDTANFVSDPLPYCGSPKHLNAEVDFESKTALLTWDPGENNIYQYIMIKEATATRYDTSRADDNFYTVNNLKLNTTYTWRLRPYCHAVYTGDEVSGRFSTSTGDEAIEVLNSFNKAFKVRTPKNQIIVENPTGEYVKCMEVYSADGRLQHRYEVNSADNVMVWHNLPQGLAVIRLIGENGQTAGYKTMIL